MVSNSRSPALGGGQRGGRPAFALFAQAMADLRRVRNASPDGVSREVLRKRFNLWERGRFALTQPVL